MTACPSLRFRCESAAKTDAFRSWCCRRMTREPEDESDEALAIQR